MGRGIGLSAAVVALVLLGASARAQDVSVVDLDAGTGSIPGSIESGKSVYITNTGASAKSDTVAGDWNIAGGKLYVGFTGSDTVPGKAIANEKVALTVNGDMNVGGATWIGKWKTTGYESIFPEIPLDPSKVVELNVGGNLNIDVADGSFLVGADGAGSSTAITVVGDTNLYTGGNHFVAYNDASLILTTSTFNLIGGEIEVIGSSSAGYADKCQVITTATSGNAVLLTRKADLTIMRKALFDLSAGGDFTVEDGSTLIGGSGGGRVVLSNGAALTVSQDSAVNLWRGSLAIDGTVDLRGKLILGYNPSTAADGQIFTSFSATTMNVAGTAKVSITDDFIKKARDSHTSGDANKTVIAGTGALNFAGWTSGQRALVENLYGKFMFTNTGNAVVFNNLQATNFADAAAAKTAASAQIARVFAQNGIGAANIPAGLDNVLLGVIAAVPGENIAGAAPLPGDGSDAAKLHAAIWKAMASGADTFSYSNNAAGVSVNGTFNSGFGSMLSNNRGANVNAVSMGVAGQARNSVLNRVADNNLAWNKVNEETGSDAALASAILNCDYRNRIWVSGLGVWEDADARNGLSGYKYDSYGFMGGYDRVFGPITAGAAVGYTGGNYQDKAAAAHDSTIDNYAVGLYATYNHCSGFFATLLGGYTYSDNDINEFDGAQWGREDFHTDTWNAGLRLGYDWKPVGCLTLTPSIGLDYVHAKNSSHQVNYGGVSLLRYGDASNHAATLPIELAAGYDIPAGDQAVLNLNARVGYSYNFNGEGMESDIFFNGLGTGALAAAGRDTGHHTFSAGAGLKYTAGRFDLGLRYDYYGKSDYDAHRVMAVAGVSF